MYCPGSRYVGGGNGDDDDNCLYRNCGYLGTEHARNRVIPDCEGTA